MRFFPSDNLNPLRAQTRFSRSLKQMLEFFDAVSALKPVPNLKKGAVLRRRDRRIPLDPEHVDLGAFLKGGHAEGLSVVPHQRC